MSEIERLQPTGDYKAALENIERGEHTPNDLRLLHHRERYEFLGYYFHAHRLTLIDIGCGYADNLAALGQLVSDSKLIGVDIDPAIIASNREKHPALFHICDSGMGVLYPRPAKGHTLVVSALEVIGNQNVNSDLELLLHMKLLAGIGNYCVLSIARCELEHRTSPNPILIRRYDAADFVELWGDAGFEDMEWFGQLYPANRLNIVAKDIFDPNPICRCDILFGDFDFMLGIGRVT